jgi:hypothetical protein
MNPILKSLVKDILPLAASPAIVMLLRFIPYLNLSPLAWWKFPVEGMILLASGVGAVVAAWVPLANAKHSVKAAWLLSSFSLACFCLLYYLWLTSSPPPGDWLWWYELQGYVCYFGFYLFVGYALANICKSIAKQTFDKKGKKNE